MTVTIANARMRMSIFSLIAVLLIAGTATMRAASSESDFNAAYAAAEAAEKEAGRLRNQWTVTATALADARRAADKGDFDRAIASATQAEALAKASIFQAISEQGRWKELEIR